MQGFSWSHQHLQYAAIHQRQFLCSSHLFYNILRILEDLWLKFILLELAFPHYLYRVLCISFQECLEVWAHIQPELLKNYSNLVHSSCVVVSWSTQKQSNWRFSLTITFKERTSHCSLKIVLNNRIDGGTSGEHYSDASTESKPEFRENSSLHSCSFSFLSFDHSIDKSFDSFMNFVVNSWNWNNNSWFDSDMIFFQFEHVSTWNSIILENFTSTKLQHRTSKLIQIFRKDEEGVVLKDIYLLSWNQFLDAL